MEYQLNSSRKDRNGSKLHNLNYDDSTQLDNNPKNNQIASFNQSRSLRILVAFPALYNVSSNTSQGNPRNKLLTIKVLGEPFAERKLPSLRDIPKYTTPLLSPLRQKIIILQAVQYIRQKESECQSRLVLDKKKASASPDSYYKKGSEHYSTTERLHKQNMFSSPQSSSSTKHFNFYDEEYVSSSEQEKQRKVHINQDESNRQLITCAVEDPFFDSIREDSTQCLELQQQLYYSNQKVKTETIESLYRSEYFQLPHIIQSSKRDARIGQSKREIKLLTQEIFKKNVLGRKLKIRDTNHMQFVSDNSTAFHLSLRSLANIKEAEFPSQNVAGRLKKSNFMKTNLLEQNAAENAKTNEVSFSKPNKSPKRLWCYNATLNNKERSLKKNRKIVLKETLLKIEKIQRKNNQFVHGIEEVQQHPFIVFHKSKSEESLQNDDNHIENDIQMSQELCDGLTSAVLDKIAEDIGNNSEVELLNSGVTSGGQSQGSSNLWSLLQNYYQFCLGKVGEEWKKQQDRKNKALQDGPTAEEAAVAAAMDAVRQVKEATFEEMSSIIQNLILNQPFIERIKQAMQFVLGSNGVNQIFINEFIKSIDTYGKFLIPTNNVKRIGIQNVMTLMRLLVIKYQIPQIVFQKNFKQLYNSICTVI